MIKVRKYIDGDMEYVRQNPFQDEVKNYPELPIPANTYTCIFDGEIVAVGGVKIFFEGVGESWIIMTKQSRKDGIFSIIACRAIKDKLDSLCVELGMRLVEANVRENFPKAIRFVEALGFEYVGKRPKWFSPKVSSLLYCKVF